MSLDSVVATVAMICLCTKQGPAAGRLWGMFQPKIIHVPTWQGQIASKRQQLVSGAHLAPHKSRLSTST